MNELPLIEYHRHPAFLDLPSVDTSEDGEAVRLTAEIDSAFLRMRSSTALSPDQLRIAFDNDIAPRMRKLRDWLVESGRIHGPFANYVTTAIDKAMGFLYAQLEFDAWRKSAGVAQADAVTRERLERMRRDGFFNFQPDVRLAENVWRATEYERAYLRNRAQQRPWAHCAIPLHPHSPGVRFVKHKLEVSGVLALASAYMGCAMEWKYCALDFSHEAQRWCRDCYSDKSLPTARTVYMHYDADTEMIKAMLYLQDVSGEQGPFRFVRGSPRWTRSPCLLSIHKGFDTVDNDVFEMESDRLDYKLGYYRPRFKLLEHRRNLMTLPAPLRGTTHFGDDVLDGSAISSALLDEEVVFTGSAGTLILFDGSAGIHRGGQVARGERWAVQIAMRAVRQPKNALQAVMETTTGRARYHAHVVKRWIKGHLG